MGFGPIVKSTSPINLTCPPQSEDEDVSLELSTAEGNLLSVQDDDTETLTITLASTHGTLTLAQTTGLTITVGDGTEDAAMTFSGTQADINAALDGMTFIPTADYNGAATITITASDGHVTNVDVIAITIAAVNDAPAITGGASDTYQVVEGLTAVGTIAATDVDLDTVTFSITGGVDAALFEIDAETGELAFIDAPVYATPLDDDEDNVYELTVTADDGAGGTDTQDIEVTVTEDV